MERQATGAARPPGVAPPRPYETVAAGAPGVAQVTPTCTPVWTAVPPPRA